MTAEITRLDNGLTVVTEAIPHFNSAAVGVWVGAGARNETPETGGISHMLEHMAFKGTRNRTTQGIAEEVEAVGGQINAYTTREFTGYYLRVLENDLPLAVDILADILQNSLFPEDELERERGVVLQEIGEALDTPDDIIFDFLQETAYPGHALGRPILGTPETVRSFRSDHLHAYMGAQYHGERMILSAAGSVRHEDVVRLAETVFTDLKRVSADPLRPADYRGGAMLRDRDLEQLHAVIGFDGLAYDDADFFAAQLLSNLWGGGMSSRLFQEVREKRGLAYSVYSFTNSYRDGGLFGVYAGSGPEDGSKLLRVIAEEIDKLNDGVEEAELDRARAQMKAAIVMGMENVSGRVDQMARQLLIFGRTYGPEELIDAIDSVDKEAVRRVAARITAGRPSVALLGPLSGVDLPKRLSPS